MAQAILKTINHLGQPLFNFKLKHLARLDRKTQDADVASLVQNFDVVLEAFEVHVSDGQEDEVETLSETVDVTPVTRPETAPKTSSGPCNTWSMSKPEPEGHGPEAKTLEDARACDPDVPVSAGLPLLEQRFRASWPVRRSRALVTI